MDAIRSGVCGRGARGDRDSPLPYRSGLQRHAGADPDRRRSGTGRAVVVGWLLFVVSVRLDVRAFFRVTSVLLILFAAGLVAHGVHELQEAGVLPVVVEHVWDINLILDENSMVGSILKALFGYNGNPSLLETMSYAAYYLIVGVAIGLEQRTARSMPGFSGSATT